MNVRAARLALLAALFALPAAADEILLAPSQDNTIYETTTGDLANGIGANGFVGQNATGQKRRGLIRFDVLSALPPAADIQSVELRMAVTRAVFGPHNVALHLALADWGEGASDAGEPGGTGAAAQPGDATWLHGFYPTVTWPDTGGRFASVASASASVGITGFSVWSSPGLVRDVQDWVDRAAPNFGWFLIGDETATSTAKRFGSRENPDTTLQPRLRISYTLPVAVPLSSHVPGVMFESPSPNPSVDRVRLAFAVHETLAGSRVRLVIHDLSGRAIRTLLDAPASAGRTQLVWDGLDAQGRPATGVLFARLVTPNGAITRRVLRLE